MEPRGISSRAYYLATVHRPHNIDESRMMKKIADVFGRLDASVVLTDHPSTLARPKECGIGLASNVRAFELVGYLDMLVLQRQARVILNDSGGVQKAACLAGTSCLNLRLETEWVQMVESSRNALALDKVEKFTAAALRQGAMISESVCAFGDGDSAILIGSDISSKV